MSTYDHGIYNPEVTFQDIVQAYRKLKAYVYKDNTLIWLKVSISEFESDGIERQLRQLLSDFNNWDENIAVKYGSRIETICLPKGFEQPSESRIISNETSRRIIASKTHTFALIPIELMILDIVWIMKHGCRLQTFIQRDCYGFRLELEPTPVSWRIKSGLHLFEPYYRNYQNWLNRGVQALSEGLSSHSRLALLSFDISNFYHSINLDFGSLRGRLFHQHPPDKLHGIWESIISRYRSLMKADNMLLPIGLLSSGVVANYYLTTVDEAFRERLKPVFYGRYVDDFIVVFKPRERRRYKDADQFIIEELVQRNILKEHTANTFALVNQDNLYIAADKTRLFLVNGKSKNSPLDAIKAELAKNRSLVQILPESIAECKSTLNDISISDPSSKRRLRDLGKVDIDRYKFALWLSRETSMALLTHNYNVSSGELRRILVRQAAIEHYLFWPRIFYLFIIARRIGSFSELLLAIIRACDSVRTQNQPGIESLRKGIRDYLKLSLTIAFSIDLDALEKLKLSKAYRNHPSAFDSFLPSAIAIEQVRAACMFDHKKLRWPISAYSGRVAPRRIVEWDGGSVSRPNLGFRFSPRRLRFSPRFIRWPEILRSLQHENGHVAGGSADIKSLIVKANQYYVLCNFTRKYPASVYSWMWSRGPVVPSLLNEVNLLELDNPLRQIEERINDTVTARIKIALANMPVDRTNIERAILGRPNTTYRRLFDINSILNAARREEVNVLIFPEVSIPYAWLNHIEQFSAAHQILIVAGLEHRLKNGFAENNTVVCIPQKNKGFRYAVSILRLKKHYSPHEVRTIHRLGYAVPNTSTLRYNAFSLPNLAMGTYNCYEIAILRDRSAFANLVDFIAIVEYNRDIEYFSSIVQSMAVDLSAFIAQVNDSIWGDSRLIAPIKSIRKNYLQIKGGRNNSIVTEEIEVSELRKFHLGLPYSLNLRKLDGNVTAEFKEKPTGFQRILKP